MDGLECSELLLSEVCKDNQTTRYDAEFFSKNAIKTEAFVSAKPHFYIEKKKVVSGPFGSTLTSSSYLSEGDVAFVRIENIKGGFFINRDNLVYISNADNARISNSQLFTDDLILSKVGNSIGYFARVDEELGSCNISENNLGIKLSGYSESQKHTILAYLNSKYGQDLLLRRISGNAQPKLNVNDVCFIPIPSFSEAFMDKISSAIKKSDSIMRKSKKVYDSAMSLLLEELNFDADKISTSGISVKNVSNSFGSSGRLDAEFYQPKFDDLLKILGELTTQPLGNIVTTKKSIEPGSECYGEVGIPFIRVSDISVMDMSSPSIYIPRNIVPSMEKLYPKKDTILFSKDGSVGIAYKMEEDAEIVTSSALLHFNVINSKEVIPDYLTLVLNSDIVQLQAERDASGAIIQHWKPGDISKVLIPILPYEKQKKIVDKVRESFTLRKNAKTLVSLVINAVETAISDCETPAIELLSGRID